MNETSNVETINGLIDSRGLAQRLGVPQATIRSWRSRGADWLPEPIGRLDGMVWRLSDLDGIEQRLPPKVRRHALHGPEDRPAPETLGSSAAALRTARRARGVYYTPTDAAHFLASWVVRESGETILEPSFGDGVFVRAANDEAARRGFERPKWVAAELDGDIAESAVEGGLLTPDELKIGDFMSMNRTPVDAVIANPPYVRLRHLPNDMRALSLERAKEHLGRAMAPSGSVWMPFVAHMVSFLNVGGRAAIVLPLDFTYVDYAKPLWEYLGRSFARVRVLRVRERIFSDINQDVLLLLADGFGGSTENLTFAAYETQDDLVREKPAVETQIAISDVLDGQRVFQKALLPARLVTLLDSALRDSTSPTSDYMTFRIGYVAGDKKYFHPTSAIAEEFELQPSHLRPTLINARRMRGHGLRTSNMVSTVADVLWHPTGQLSKAESTYVLEGERMKVHEGYKASQRSPWYVVPGVNTPDLILTVFSERPLLVINDAKWAASNSLLCGYVKRGSVDAFTRSWYTPLTLLSIGLQVHSLGGGVIVMVPNEASSVRILTPQEASSESDAILRSALEEGDLSAAYSSGDRRISELFGDEALALIHEGIAILAHWRTR